MNDRLDTFDSTANPPIESLNPHQILTLIVKWARLKNYWFQGDRDELYALKDRFIQQWVEDGSMFAKAILQRESVAITRYFRTYSIVN
jgi:hypothetical protein